MRCPLLTQSMVLPGQNLNTGTAEEAGGRYTRLSFYAFATPCPVLMWSASVSATASPVLKWLYLLHRPSTKTAVPCFQDRGPNIAIPRSKGIKPQPPKASPAWAPKKNFWEPKPVTENKPMNSWRDFAGSSDEVEKDSAVSYPPTPLCTAILR